MMTAYGVADGMRNYLGRQRRRNFNFKIKITIVVTYNLITLCDPLIFCWSSFESWIFWILLHTFTQLKYPTVLTLRNLKVCFMIIWTDFLTLKMGLAFIIILIILIIPNISIIWNLEHIRQDTWLLSTLKFAFT